MIDLLTSLPPELRRFDATGAPIGERYQEQCVESWLEAGCSVTSLNAPAELESLPRRFAGVRYVATHLHARESTGRYYVQLAAFIEAARSMESEHIAITNADITLDPRAPTLRKAAALQPGEALLFKRRDVAEPGLLEGPEHYWGYDLICLHKSDLEALDDGGMVHGVPWWDYYVPMLLFLRGVRARVEREPVAFHLLHEERWKQRLWRRFGLRYAHFLLDHRQRMPQEVAYRVRGRGRRLQLGTLRAKPLRPRLTRFLDRLALSTVRFIDQQ